jgi:hypothetical protein
LSTNSETAFFLEAKLDLGNMKAIASRWNLPFGLPKLDVTVSGSPQGLTTKGILNFPAPLPFDFQPWNIPTNLIHGPLHSFAAVQGLKPFLASLSFWSTLQKADPPNDIYFWAQSAAPTLTFAAFPRERPTEFLAAVGERLFPIWNPWLATLREGQLSWSPSAQKMTWAGVPMMSPFLQTATNSQTLFVLSGFGPGALTDKPLPDWLIPDILSRTNLVLYEQEFTGGRVDAWLYLSQTLRLVGWKAQLPRESVFINWFKSVGEKLGNTKTLIFKTGDQQLQFERSSSIGFNSLELNLLADWFESPRFPQALHTFSVPGPPIPKRWLETNSPTPASITNTNK